MKRMLRFAAMIIIFATTIGSAQRIVPTAPFVLNVDYARFRYDDKSAYLEIYYGFYPSRIVFEKMQDKYLGGVRLYTKLRNKGTGELVINERAFLPVSADDTTQASFRSTFITQAGYAIPYGEYVLDVNAIDSLNQTRCDSVSLPITLSVYSSGVATSDLELCSNLKASEQKRDPFYKNSLEVVPNPTLVFGVTSHPVVFNYSELYNLNKDETYRVKTQIVNQGGVVVKEGSKTRKYGFGQAVEVGTLNVTSITSGKYRFRLVLEDGAGTSITQTEKAFFIHNPHLRPADSPYSSLRADELAGLSAEELAEEFRRAQYVATDTEIKMFSQITSEAGRREFLAKFWAEVETGRQGRSPTTRAEYLKRVKEANERFGHLFRQGWNTDRGRVHILYGQPDEIQRFPSSDVGKPYEIWRYYQIESGVDFIFVERSGFGEYVLVHSTKRDELHDENWSRFLR